ncbi:hypothetical protein AG1IA_07369 [Rhizoctonia solani AG-1 IA]|uniref:Uncharacterized protein n=1 Tax=Thanatephorus cucumeris (strain AG1-IA) TaxID=983506 RepID=L8WK73_THACA|nr:hypothetical protein AG1IA_07369 [Rhizoctonia solani AG-1 IA]
MAGEPGIIGISSAFALSAHDRAHYNSVAPTRFTNVDDNLTPGCMSNTNGLLLLQRGRTEGAPWGNSPRKIAMNNQPRISKSTKGQRVKPPNGAHQRAPLLLEVIPDGCVNPNAAERSLHPANNNRGHGVEGRTADNWQFKGCSTLTHVSPRTGNTSEKTKQTYSEGEIHALEIRTRATHELFIHGAVQYFGRSSTVDSKSQRLEGVLYQGSWSKMHGHFVLCYVLLRKLRNLETLYVPSTSSSPSTHCHIGWAL